jgi:hypothetical protein
MLDRVTRLFEPLLRLLWPPEGRHRSHGGRPIAALPAQSASASVPSGPAPQGEDGPLVRPYFVAHERQRNRPRRLLWVAGYGIDVGPRGIRGVEVGA